MLSHQTLPIFDRQMRQADLNFYPPSQSFTRIWRVANVFVKSWLGHVRDGHVCGSVMLDYFLNICPSSLHNANICFPIVCSTTQSSF